MIICQLWVAGETHQTDLCVSQHGDINVGENTSQNTILPFSALNHNMAVGVTHHPFYVSVTDAHYKPETRTIEMAQKVFWDDLESVLSQNYKSKVDLKKGTPLDMLPEWIREYTLSHHFWEVNDKPCHLEFLGYEIEEDVIWLFMEVKEVEPPKHLVVKNSMLTDFLPGQKNITHFYIQNRTLSVITDKKNPTEELQF